ncbi:MAG: hypothetical protein ACFFB0_06365 [Promethearchaeota archaeon]
MENSQHSLKKDEIRYGHGIAAGVISIISVILFIELKGFLNEPFAFDYYQISYIIIAVLTFASLVCSRFYLLPGLVIMTVAFVMAVINAFLFLFVEYWKFWNVAFTLIHLLFVITFLLIGINISNLAKILRNK